MSGETEEVRLVFAGQAEMPRPAAVEPPAGPAETPPPAAAQPAAPAPAPTARLLPDGTLVDAKGRKLKLRQLTLLQEMDLIALAGDGRAMNRLWWVQTSHAARVADIDGIPLPFPTTDPELRAMIARVDREGVAAVIEHASAEGGTSPDEENHAKN